MVKELTDEERAIRAHIISFANRCFLETADDNYILLRIAYFNNMHTDFWWLALHAIEKYFKALLLINNLSCKDYNHDIIKLYNACLTIDPSMFDNHIIKPDFFPEEHWINHSFREYIEHIDNMASPSNRYLSRGHYVLSDDLIKIDTVIWNIRRYCTILHQDVCGLSMLELIKKNRNYISTSQTSFFQKLQKMNPYVKKAFEYQNSSFFPNENHIYQGFSFSSVNSPIDLFAQEIYSDKKRNKEITTATLERLKSLVKFSSDDLKDINDMLSHLSKCQ